MFKKQEEIERANHIGNDADHEDLPCNLRRRPRCLDGTLNLRFKANQSFQKHDLVTNFYDPKDPSINLGQDVIKIYLLKRLRASEQTLQAAEFITEKLQA